jgi:hypothetical protein
MTHLPLSEGAIEYTEDWRNEHGEPNFAFLQSLQEDGGPEAIEKLRSIADDLDVEYDPDAPAEDLIGRIRLVTQQNEDGNPIVTS